jgi:ribosomal protein S18 acetylase RimI-like enzyme
MQWANSNLSINNFCLNVLSSNVRAINLYEKLGFSISQRVPVKPDPNCEWGSLIDDLENSEKNNSLYRLTMTLVFTDRRR